MNEKIYFKIDDWNGIKFPTLDDKLEYIIDCLKEKKEGIKQQATENLLSEIACDKALDCNIFVKNLTRIPAIGERIKFKNQNVFGWGNELLSLSEIFPTKKYDVDCLKRFTKLMLEYGYDSNESNIKKAFDSSDSNFLCNNLNLIYQVTSIKTEFDYIKEDGNLARNQKTIIYLKVIC
jgi:hypothetical protein